MLEIAGIISLATQGMQALKTGTEAAKTIREITRDPGPGGIDAEDVKAQVQKLQDALEEAREINMGLRDQLHELKNEIYSLDTRKEISENYHLGTYGYAKVMVQNFLEGDVAKRHVICPYCSENGKKSVLQERNAFLSCPPCGADIQYKDIEWGSL